MESASKTELLMPAGNVENFYAAAEGGADAVYLGLKQFNARGRASNFNFRQLHSLCLEAEKYQMKVYVTLNTVIKNKELPELLDTLHILNKTKVNAIIIQDWGVYHFLSNYYPGLVIHASTQMANHNSAGAEFSRKLGFERVILARELTHPELKTIAERTSIELEVFTHGALCYSFSGMCLFSSYLGGAGANRGFCTQPCRREFSIKDDASYIFSLKDNQLIDLLPDLVNIGISSVKIEGRLKSAEYVNRVASAYRMVLDDRSRMDQAKALLEYDMGREKTAYFMGGDISEAITMNPQNGLLLGGIVEVHEGSFTFKCMEKVEPGYRLRIRNKERKDSINVKVKEISRSGEMITVKTLKKDLSVGDQVYLAGIGHDEFPVKLPERKFRNINSLSFEQKQKMLKRLNSQGGGKEEIFVRINSPEWLRKLRLDDFTGVILNFSLKEWKDVPVDAPFMKKFASLFLIELPKFIPEGAVESWQKHCKSLLAKGFIHFILSHISQKLLLPSKAKVSTNENVYVYNDAAAAFLKREKVTRYVYPLENEFDNLKNSRDKSGIVPVYYRPQLFYSRMPVKIGGEGNQFVDDGKNVFHRYVKDGITVIVPEIPVSITNHKEKLTRVGFRRFLIDLSFEQPSKHVIKRILNKLQYSEQIQPSTGFNFRKGLK